MARTANQKLKILYVLKLLETSDETHVVTMKEILEELARHGIRAERKRIYDDLDALREFGYSIVGKRGRMAGYYLESREGLPTFPETEKAACAVSREDAESVGKNVGAEAKVSGETERADRRQVKTADYEWLSGDTKVELLCEEKMAAFILEELGENGSIREKASRKTGSAVLKFRVKQSREFYGWLARFGCRVRVNSPSFIIREYRKYLKEIRNMYKDN